MSKKGLSINFYGDKELAAALKKNRQLIEAKKVVKEHSAHLAEQTKNNMSKQYRGHYEWRAGRGEVFIKPTNATKNSVTSTISNGGLSSSTTATTEYFAYLELGTRFMAARPTLVPAWRMEQVAFISDLRKLVR